MDIMKSRFFHSNTDFPKLISRCCLLNNALFESRRFENVFSIFHVFIFEFWGLVSRCFSIQAASNDSTSSTSLLFPYTIMSYLSLMLQADEEDKRQLREDEADFNTLPKCKIDEASKEAKDWAQTVAEERAKTYEQRRQEAITRDNKHQAVEDNTNLKRKRELMAKQYLD